MISSMRGKDKQHVSMWMRKALGVVERRLTGHMQALTLCLANSEGLLLEYGVNADTMLLTPVEI